MTAILSWLKELYYGDEMTIDTMGTKRWTRNGKLHRDGEPAVVEPDGSQAWFSRGLCHRIDGPAYIRADGTTYWKKNGLYHREDGPSVEYHTGNKYWHKNGKLHREDGPAHVYKDFVKEWYINAELHRLDGPAVESFGEKKWYRNGIHWPEGEKIYLIKLVTNIALAMAPLDLPAYILLWILEFVEPDIKKLNQIRLIELLQNLKRKPQKV